MSATPILPRNPAPEGRCVPAGRCATQANAMQQRGSAALASAGRPGGIGQTAAGPDTTNRCGAVSAAKRPRMRLLSFTPRIQGALRGFATVELPIGLRLYDVLVFSGDKGPWAALPTKPQLDRERRQKIRVDGKPLFWPIAEWRNRELADRFSTAVVELIRQAHPDAFDP